MEEFDEDDDDVKVPFRLQLGGQSVLEGECSAKLLEVLPEGVMFLFPEKKQSSELKVTPIDTTEQDRIVQQLLCEGRATYKILLGNKTVVEFETKSSGDLLDLAVLPAGFKAPRRATGQWLPRYEIIRTLAASIVSWGGRPIGADPKNPLSREEFIKNQPGVVTEMLADGWNEFQEVLKRALKPKALGLSLKG